MRGLMWLLLVLLMPLWRAQAQPTPTPDALDPFAPPWFGSAALVPGFAPDPYRIPRIVSPGEISANELALGADCVGFIRREPDFRVTAMATFRLLRFIFIADALTNDSALIVRDPAGRYLCNNNSYGLFNPTVDVTSARPGDYAVWISGFEAGEPVYGELFITQDGTITPGTTGLNVPVPPPTLPPILLATPSAPAVITPLQAGSAPTFGGLLLEHGFLPDPAWRAVIGGGRLQVRGSFGGDSAAAARLNAECGGYTDPAPHVRVRWSGESTRLRFIFLPVSEANPALIVRAPDGNWVCNRDFLGYLSRPMVEFVLPLAGDYDIWVTHEDTAGVGLPGLLYITEKPFTPETIPQADMRAFPSLNGLTLSAAAGVPLFTSDTDDPFRVAGLVAGGEVDIDALNPDINRPNPNLGCEGYFPALPSYTFTLAQPQIYWRAFFVSDAAGDDPTMIVRMPDGVYYCGDDSFGGLNPTVNVIGNFSTGTVQIWLGSYAQGVVLTGSLYLTRGSADPTNPTRPYAPPAELTAEAADIPPTPSALSVAGEAKAGVVSLDAAFDDPYIVEVYGGGEVDLAAVGFGCAGYVTALPDLRLTWTGGLGGLLRFFYTGEGDATLAVYAPDGRWYCNDDSFGTLHPTVDFAVAQDGVYIVWVGSRSHGMGAFGALTVTRNPLLVPTVTP